MNRGLLRVVLSVSTKDEHTSAVRIAEEIERIFSYVDEVGENTEDMQIQSVRVEKMNK